MQIGEKGTEQSGRQFSTPLTKPASELEEAYRLASSEVDAEWDITVADGLTNETW